MKDVGWKGVGGGMCNLGAAGTLPFAAIVVYS